MFILKLPGIVHYKYSLAFGARVQPKLMKALYENHLAIWEFNKNILYFIVLYKTMSYTFLH